MRALAGLVVLALLAAGCLGPQELATADGADAATHADRMPPRVLVAPDETMWEPSLGAAPDGTLFVTGFRRLPDGSTDAQVYRSPDGGATWEPIGSPTAPLRNSDPELVVDDDGAVWVSTLWIGCVAVAVSRDGGDTWRTNPVVCPGVVGDRQRLVATRGGEAYLDWQQFPTKLHVAARTTDHGATWQPLGPIEPATQPVYVTGDVSGWGGGGFWNRATGSVFFAFTWYDGDGPNSASYEASPAVSVTRDQGQTWELVRLPPMEGRHHGVSVVSGGADDAGTIYLSWAETGADGDTRVLLSRSQDDGRTWSAPLRLDAAGGSKAMPTLVAGAAGEVAVAWQEANEPGHPGEVGAEARWRPMLAWTTDADAPVPTLRRMPLSDTPALRGPLCLDGLSCSGGRELGEYFDLERLPDGRLAAVWASTGEANGRTTLAFAATTDPLLTPRP